MSRTSQAALVVILCFIWGSTWLVIKIGLQTLPPFLSAGLRFGLAASVLFGLSAMQGVPVPRGGRVHLGLLAHGLCGISLSYGAVYWGQQFIPSGLSAILFATNPFFVMLLAHGMIAGERVTGRRLLGVIIGFAGVALIFQDDLQMSHPMSLAAAGVTLLSPLAAAASNVSIKRWGGHLHPYTLTALPMTYAPAALFAVSWAAEDVSRLQWTVTAVGSIAYLAVIGSVAAFAFITRCSSTCRSARWRSSPTPSRSRRWCWDTSCSARRWSDRRWRVRRSSSWGSRSPRCRGRGSPR